MTWKMKWRMNGRLKFKDLKLGYHDMDIIYIRNQQRVLIALIKRNALTATQYLAGVGGWRGYCVNTYTCIYIYIDNGHEHGSYYLGT